jgi:hypothetical protein
MDCRRGGSPGRRGSLKSGSVLMLEPWSENPLPSITLESPAGGNGPETGTVAPEAEVSAGDRNWS